MTKLDQNRLYWIDAIRSFACLCVLLSHSVIPGGTRGSYIINPLQYFVVAGASVLFFMISGALVFNKPKPLVPFIKKRLTRIFLPMVIWTVLTLLVYCMAGKMEWSQLGTSLLLLPFTQQYGPYWFIYVIFGIYLFAPMVATWLEKCSRSELLVLLVVGFVAMAVPYLRIVNKDFSKGLFLETGSLYYFVGYLWVCLTGYYIRRYVNITKFKWWHALVLVAVVAMPLLLGAAGEPYSVIKKRTSLNVVLLCACYFIILKHVRLGDGMKQVVFVFAKHTFGIYLVHKQVIDFIVAPVVKRLDLSYVVSIPLVFIATLALSYVIVHLISKLPWSDYLIAHHS